MERWISRPVHLWADALSQSIRFRRERIQFTSLFKLHFAIRHCREGRNSVKIQTSVETAEEEEKKRGNGTTALCLYTFTI